MKASILIILLMLFARPVSAENIDGLISSTPNIVYGKVIIANPNYLLVEVSWELKGKLNSEIIEVPMDRSRDNGLNYAIGDRLLVFVGRNAIKPMKNLPLSDLQLSAFDEFEGQCAFMKILVDMDYDLVGRVFSKIHGRDMVAVIP